MSKAHQSDDVAPVKNWIWFRLMLVFWRILLNPTSFFGPWEPRFLTIGACSWHDFLPQPRGGNTDTDTHRGCCRALDGMTTYFYSIYKWIYNFEMIVAGNHLKPWKRPISTFTTDYYDENKYSPFKEGSRLPLGVLLSGHADVRRMDSSGDPIDGTRDPKGPYIFTDGKLELQRIYVSEIIQDLQRCKGRIALVICSCCFAKEVAQALSKCDKIVYAYGVNEGELVDGGPVIQKHLDDISQIMYSFRNDGYDEAARSATLKISSLDAFVSDKRDNPRALTNPSDSEGPCRGHRRIPEPPLLLSRFWLWLSLLLLP